jgi:hypothetical protein
VNDTSWRNLSAILGVACVVLIIAAGALLATSGESASPSLSGSSAASVIPSDSGPIVDSSANATPSTPSVSASPTVVPTGGPTATPAPKAPIVQVTFNNLMLDSSTDTSGKARTLTFVTDGLGPVGIAITKSSAKDTTKICATVDDSKPDCRVGTRVSYAGAFTDTAHSVWVITLIGNHAAKPTIDLSLSWPSNTPQITLTHGRLQGTGAGVPAALNGFTATVKTTAAGNLTLSSSWTVITTNVQVTTEDLSSSPATTVDQKQFTGVTNLGQPGYSFAVGAVKSYRISLRNMSADSMRPDLTAIISVP